MIHFRPWVGLMAGLAAWYGAHELGFYLLGPNCGGKRWLIPAIHAVALAIALAGAWVSAMATGEAGGGRRFAGTVGSGAGLLFGFAILWQGVAASFFYTGCER